MMPNPHLSEDERQQLADGSLGGDPLRDALDHLSGCNACAADVSRLRTLMTRVRNLPTADDADDLWPEIRARVEQSKIVPLAAPNAVVASSLRPIALGVAAVAAGLVLAVVAIRPRTAPAVNASAADSSAAFTNVADSTQSYETEANTLLNELEMQRAMLRPGTSAAIDRDLQTIDRSIAELTAALVRDPNNPALRRLLASSYRQKVDLLKRATNAG
jgi:hypothetical protein